MNKPLEVALAGAGLVGRRHAEALQQCGDALKLTAIADPSLETKDFSENLGVRWFPSISDLFSGISIDGIIIATPNLEHVSNGLEAVQAKCPMLVEKPIASDSKAAGKLMDAANGSGVPVLVGHHRRHNPLVRKAKSIIESGRLGRLVSVHVSCWFLKPDEYYAPEWRRKPGAGPVLVNGIHDVDLMRHFCGEVVQVFAQSSNSTRGHEIEDSMNAVLEFKSNLVGTMSLSDSVASPWSWELTSGENPSFPKTSESSIRIGGTKGSLSVPDNRIWKHVDGGHWTDPIDFSCENSEHADPLVMQLSHFAAVIRGEEKPLVSGEEGIASLKVIEAILLSAKENRPVRLGNG